MPEVERAFTVNDDEQIVRARLLNRMKKLGFKVISENDELKFKRGSPFADEPSYRMYITVRLTVNATIGTHTKSHEQPRFNIV